jgi:hypothetical protein
MEWQPIDTAPHDLDLELAVIDEDGPYALVFPCRRATNGGGWVSSESKRLVEVDPTHWREWVPKPL